MDFLKKTASIKNLREIQGASSRMLYSRDVFSPKKLLPFQKILKKSTRMGFSDSFLKKVLSSPKG